MPHSNCRLPIRCCSPPDAIRIVVNGEHPHSLVDQTYQPVALTPRPYRLWLFVRRRSLNLRQLWPPSRARHLLFWRLRQPSLWLRPLHAQPPQPWLLALSLQAQRRRGPFRLPWPVQRLLLVLLPLRPRSRAGFALLTPSLLSTSLLAG